MPKKRSRRRSRHQANLILIALLIVGLLYIASRIGVGSPLPSSTLAPPTPGLPKGAATANGAVTPDTAAAACVPSSNERMLALVTQVVDGDTIDVDISGKPYTVRYIGVDTPESTRSVEYFGSQATQVNKELVEGKTVTLVKDVSETDRFGRLLRYVFVGELFVNYELARQGYAYAVTYPPDIACKDIFRAAEMAARESGAGLWAATPAIDQATASPTPGEGSGNCDPAYPDVCIPPPPPDLDCNDISHRRFRVLSPDPHNFDVNVDGVGCER